MNCYSNLDLILGSRVQGRIKCQVLKEANILKLALKDDITFLFTLSYFIGCIPQGNVASDDCNGFGFP